MRNELIDLYNLAISYPSNLDFVRSYQSARDRIGPQIVLNEILELDAARARIAELEAELDGVRRGLNAGHEPGASIASEAKEAGEILHAIGELVNEHWSFWPDILDGVKQLMAENGRMWDALTPSAETEKAYAGWFTFQIADWSSPFMIDAMVPWSTIKEIMHAIRDRAALAAKG